MEEIKVEGPVNQGLGGGPNFVPAVCTQCGAPITVDPTQEAAVCSHCGTPFVVAKAISQYNVTRADIVKRHYRSYNDYYVTCHYPLSSYDIQRITRNRVTKLSSQTGSYTFDRKLEKFEDRFRRQFTAVYRYLIGKE